MPRRAPTGRRRHYRPSRARPPKQRPPPPEALGDERRRTLLATLETSTDTAQLAELAWCCADVFARDGRTRVPHPQRGLPVEYDDLQQRH